MHAESVAWVTERKSALLTSAAAAIMSVLLIFGQTALDAMGVRLYWVGGH